MNSSRLLLNMIGSAANHWEILLNVLYSCLSVHKTPAVEKYTITCLAVLYKMLANHKPTNRLLVKDLC